MPSARAMTGFNEDRRGKMILYVFGFTHNNAEEDNKRIRALRIIVMAGSVCQVQNTCIHTQCVRYVKNNR
jgi:hypothetical protein